ncbi:MAG TPA: hypothetical protein VG387_18730 [Rhizomicrobium sp.]|jgi:hypothetical protein|nr:hypothetical protein [Rhizomicrobium sp.]
MKRALLGIFAVAMLVGSVTTADARWHSHHHRHCSWHHHHRVCW